jgi:hypothetical protein
MLAKTLEPMTYIAGKPPACKGVAVQNLANLKHSGVEDGRRPARCGGDHETGSRPVQEMSSLTKIRAWPGA